MKNVDRTTPDLLAAAQALAKVLGETHVLVVGGLAGFLLGVERFTADVDLAVDLAPNTALRLLRDQGIEASLRKGDLEDPLPWVIHGQIEAIPFQILPAATIQVNVQEGNNISEFGVRIVSVRGLIDSKTFAGGMQDMHDVAVLVLLHPKLEAFAREKAKERGVIDKLETWLQDARLRSRYPG
jgi:hypothetical protein